MQLLAIVGLVVLLFAGSEAYTVWNSGAGDVYTLPVTQDVWLEGTSNKNNFEFIIVGTHPGFPRKRSLLQFESLPSGCTHIEWAKMYVHFWYAHKASGQPVTTVPYISRTVEVYQVREEWNETETTSIHRLTLPLIEWEDPYLALDGTDADPHVIGSATVFTSRPKRDFVEFDITEAMRNWQYGDPNHGVLLVASNESAEGRDLRFTSKEHSQAKRHAFVNVLCDM